jgi:hypothetical protein
MRTDKHTEANCPFSQLEAYERARSGKKNDAGIISKIG